MTPHSIHHVFDKVAKFKIAVEFLERHYGVYRDGNGTEHFVSGPACAQVRALPRELENAAYWVRNERARGMPAIDLSEIRN